MTYFEIGLLKPKKRGSVLSTKKDQKYLSTKSLDKIIYDLRAISNALPLLVFRKLYGKDKSLNIIEENFDSDILFAELLSDIIADVAPEIEDAFRFLIEEMDKSELPILIEKFKNIVQFSDEEIDQLLFSPELNMRYRFSDDFGSRSIELLAQKILTQIDSDTVVDLCSGQGMFLASCFYDGIANNIVGQEINYTTYCESVLRLRALGATTSSMYCGDVIKNPFWENENVIPKFDRIYSDFPWGMKAGFYEYFLKNFSVGNDFNDYNVKKIKTLDRQTFKNLKVMFEKFGKNFSKQTRMDWFFIMQMVLLLSEKGKAVGVIPDSITYRYIDREYREQLVRGKMVEAIIKLPPALKPNTKLTTVLLVLSHNNDSIKMIDAGELGNTGRGRTILSSTDIEQIYNFYMSDQDNEKVITVTDEMMADMEFAFDPTKYLCDVTKELKYPHRLGDVIRDVYRGAQFSVKGKEVDTDTGYYLLNIKDIEVGTVNDNLVRLEESVGAQYASFALEKNDIVISARGNNVKCGIYRGDNEKIVIPSGNILTIRPDEKKINPDYLNVFLNSMTGQLLLKNIHTGGVIVSINKNQLLDLVISIPPLEKQNKIANEYRLKQERLLLAKKKIFRLENELADLFESMMGE